MTAYATTTTDAGDVARVEWVNVLADSGDQSVRNHWRWTVEPAVGWSVAGEDLTSAMDVLDPDPIEALRSLGAFLSSYSEHMSYWSCQHSDEPCQSGDCPRGTFPGLDGEIAGTIADHIENAMPREFDNGGDGLLTIRAVEIDQDGRGPNEWLITAHANPDTAGDLIVSTSSPEPLLDTFRAAGVAVAVCEHDPHAVATCGRCARSWCDDCDPTPSALCPWCHGRGWSTAPRGGAENVTRNAYPESLTTIA